MACAYRRRKENQQIRKKKEKKRKRRTRQHERTRKNKREQERERERERRTRKENEKGERERRTRKENKKGERERRKRTSTSTSKKSISKSKSPKSMAVVVLASRSGDAWLAELPARKKCKPAPPRSSRHIQRTCKVEWTNEAKVGEMLFDVHLNIVVSDHPNVIVFLVVDVTKVWAGKAANLEEPVFHFLKHGSVHFTALVPKDAENQAAIIRELPAIEGHSFVGPSALLPALLKL